MASRNDADLLGRYEVVRPSPDRQMAMDAFAALPASHPMVGLLELDVTRALSAIGQMRARGQRVSLFAFVVQAIARAISEHPDLNLVRHGKRLVRFEDVDVSVPVEVQSPHGAAPREVVIRRAQHKTACAIYEELAAAREQYAAAGELGAEDRWVRRLQGIMRFVPRPLRLSLVRAMLRDAFRIKARAGTTLVTSVGKFASIPGFSFSFGTGPRAAMFAIGSVVDRPWVDGDAIVVRKVLSVSVMVDHDLVDGAPATRFASRLQALIESADGLEAQPRPHAAAPRGDARP
jgi:pyruvate/2-oxoglutarate dehydrogenase complex dihydrolipoamide acyltransferase (E2) component